MKVILFGDKIEEIVEMVKKSGFEIVDSNPDFIISYGGDGTFLKAEFLYPEFPKILLKASRMCKKCEALPNEQILTKIREGKYSIEQLWKLEINFSDKTLYSLNDIVIHNSDPRHAIRYQILIDGVNVGDEIIGDGIVAATPFGSTGYFRSIAHSYFEVGLGIAFNNSNSFVNHLILEENKKIMVLITRGPAEIYVDNQPNTFILNDKESATIQKSDKTAKIIRIIK